MRWIDKNDELPGAFIDILFLGWKKDSLKITASVYNGSYVAETGFCVLFTNCEDGCSGSLFEYEFSHWMPIPKYPLVVNSFIESIDELDQQK